MLLKLSLKLIWVNSEFEFSKLVWNRLTNSEIAMSYFALEIPLILKFVSIWYLQEGEYNVNAFVNYAFEYSARRLQ